MTEELNNFNTDLKELFTQNKLEELVETLNNSEDDVVMELTTYNYDIIKKYYEAEKFNLIFQYIRFVAFSSFLCEYSYQRKLVEQAEFDGMMGIFNGIYELLQSNN